MNSYLKMTNAEFEKEYEKLMIEYKKFKSKGLKLDMSRGKPCTEQVELSMSMLNILDEDTNFMSECGGDCRNYGFCDGIPEIKQMMAEYTELNADDFIVGGNSSLSMMYDAISHFMTHGVNGGKPWIKQEKIKFLCPVPGYDRHFAICEYFNIELVAVPLTESGPDMDMIERLVLSDESIKGIWCVPKYSNPSGVTYSNETVKRLANLKPLASDFRIFWDNAYFAHDLQDKSVPLLNIMNECKKCGNEHLPIMFFSTSKITFPGSGVAFMACRGENLKEFKKMYSIKTVGFDKVNQLRHYLFLKNNLYEHMQKHRNILKPKFDIVLNSLKSEFDDNRIINWSMPKGGYFVSVDTAKHCAKRVVELCANAGVKLTNAGATYPYGIQNDDTNIRLAPTYPSLQNLSIAMKLFCLCVKIAFVEKSFKKGSGNIDTCN